MKKAFTLVETLVVLTVIGLLSVILIRSYIQMSSISYRVEQEKNVTQEVLFASEVLQNIADRNSIDYEAYKKHFGGDIITLTEQEWLVDVLYFSGLDGQFSVHTEWDCIDPGLEYSVANYANDWLEPPECYLVMEKDGDTTPLTNPQKAYFSQSIFKVIPFADIDDYFSADGDDLCDPTERNYFTCTHHPGFWLMMKAYSPGYGRRWANNVVIPIQQFFNLQ